MKRWVKILLIFQSVALIVLIVIFRIQKTEAVKLKAEAEFQAGLAMESQAEAEMQAEMAEKAMAMARMAELAAKEQAELMRAQLERCSSK